MQADAGVTAGVSSLAGNGVGTIGGADASTATPALNPNAIDTEVTTLAARSGQGIYVSEADGLDIATVAVTIHDVKFNSTDPDLADGNLSGLTTTANGPIKIVNLAGDITVSPAALAAETVSAGGAGDVLLRSFADLIVNADVSSGSGHITMTAGDDISLGADVTTGGTGTVYLLASNAFAADAINGVDMASASVITTGAGNVRLVADNGSDVRLGRIISTSGSVSLTADGSVVNNTMLPNVNVVAPTLRMLADADSDNVGAIGSAATPITTAVGTLAAQSADGIYISESDAVTVGASGNIATQTVRFISTRLVETDPTLSDLTTTDNGNIQLISGGTMTLTDGTDLDGLAVAAAGSGDINLRANGAGSDILVNAGVVSATGDIAIVARDNIELAARVQTSQVAVTSIQLEATDGHIDETDAASVIGNNLTLNAATYAHLHDVNVRTLVSAVVGSNGVLDNGFQTRNATANTKGGEFIGDLSTLSPAQQVALQQDYLFETKYSGNYALYLKNSQNLVVNTVAAGDGVSATPNVYIETVGANNLMLQTQISTLSPSNEEGGVVLVAGGDFAIQPGGQIVTTSAKGGQLINQIGGPGNVVGATFFNAGQGIAGDPDLTTTQFVVKSASAESEIARVLQRVVIQFGFNVEAGFEAIIGYADGYGESFLVNGDVGVKPTSALVATPVNAADMSAILATPGNAALFSRSTEFTTTFLNTNVNLPTDAALRRASDFFIFEGASSPATIQDLTVQTQAITNVTSVGAEAYLELPEDPARPEIGYVVPKPVYVIAEPPPPPPVAELELPFAREQKIEVVIYQVDFVDINRNGQVESFEIPTFLDVVILEAEGKLDAPEARVRTVDATGGKEPSQADIDRAKAELLADPDQPSGSYAIIKQSTEEGSTVLDVFGIRDWPEDPALQQAQEAQEADVEIVLPVLEPFDPSKIEALRQEATEPRPAGDDGSKNEADSASDDALDGNASLRVDSVEKYVVTSEANPNSRFASAGLLMGSLMMLRHRGQQNASAVSQANSSADTMQAAEQAKTGFGRAARRRRGLNR